MSISILMPALSPTMQEGNLVKWLKKEGDSVKAGQVLCEIETDKATMEVEAVDEGTLGKILIQEGTEGVLVNTPIAILLEKGEDAVSLKDIDSAKAPPPIAAISKTEPTSKSSKQDEDNTFKKDQTNIKNRIFSSPLARRLAEQNNLDIHQIEGSGPNGRVIKQDVLNVAAHKSLPNITQNTPSFEDVKLTLMRKTVAKRLTESKNTVPHFYLTLDCEMDSLLDLRHKINSKSDVKISVNDMLIKIVAKCLIDVPKMNVTWHDTHLRYYKNADISVAVAIDGGLVTPIIFNANTLSFSDISKTTKTLIEKARLGKLQPQEYEGGTFTLSNLGMFGVKNFGAIINPPQGAILAVGASEKRMIVKDDKPVIATIMSVTLSVDHRSVDGALGAEFLKHFKNYIENPIMLFI
ncbi:MAG: pyruvate dehydrogenase complex dihydrolipoamide acetyltransferase [Proteobacteria bacterium]|nr:pyruvate dehydrogenase complex dihydrolipoamide acetyltransferase [Pseudomonadota bacterium]